MFDNYHFDATEGNLQHLRARLARLNEIQDELKMLAQARDRIIRELTSLKALLETHRQAGVTLRHRAVEVFERLARQAEEEAMSDRPLTADERSLIADLDDSRMQLEQDVSVTERRLRIAQFEADSLAQMLEDLEDQVAELAADLEFGEDGLPDEQN